MKRLMIAVALLAGLAVTAMAQGIDRFFDNARVRKELNLTDKEVQDLQKAWDDTQKTIQVANADRDVKAAELKRLLLDNPVNMAAVQKSLRDAMDIEYAIRLAQIERALKEKEILGDKRWADLQSYLRGLQTRMYVMNQDELKSLVDKFKNLQNRMYGMNKDELKALIDRLKNLQNRMDGMNWDNRSYGPNRIMPRHMMPPRNSPLPGND